MELRKGEITVKMLREILEMFQDDYLVLVDGYEGGVMSLLQENITEEIIDYHSLTDAGETAEYVGDHGHVNPMKKGPLLEQLSKFKKPRKAIVLGRHG